MFCEGGPSGCDGREASRTVGQVQGSAKASPGYFAIDLQSNTQAEVTVTHHAALYRLAYSNFTAHATAKPIVLFDLSNDLSQSFQGGEQTFEFMDHQVLRIRGFGQFNPSFGVNSYRVSPMSCTRYCYRQKFNHRLSSVSIFRTFRLWESGQTRPSP